MKNWDMTRYKRPEKEITPFIYVAQTTPVGFLLLEIRDRIEELKTELNLKKVKYGITFSYSKQIELLSDIKALALTIKELKRLVA